MGAMAERRGWPLLVLDNLEHGPAFSRPEAVAEVLPYMLGNAIGSAPSSNHFDEFEPRVTNVTQHCSKATQNYLSAIDTDTPTGSLDSSRRLVSHARTKSTLTSRPRGPQRKRPV